MATEAPMTLMLRVPAARVHGELERFPVRVEITVSAGSRDRLAAGVRARDGEGPLPARLTADPATGRVEGWVEVRRLSPGSDATVYLDIGVPGEGGGLRDWALFGDGASDGSTDRGPRADAGARGATPAEEGDLLVEGWVRVAEARAEAAQVVAAQWEFAERMIDFATYDAGATGGLATRGFFGAVFDGRHVYFSPQCNDGGRHGQALRHDTHGAFDDPAAWEGYDAGETDGLVTRGYYGAVFDGRHVYYVPRTDGQTHHRRVLRYDTTGGFRDPASWAAHDAGEPISCQGGAFDGRYVYFAPGYHQQTGPSGRVLRYDTSADFHDPAAWATHDVDGTGGLRCRNFDGALYDGRHVYFAPLDGGAVVRHDPGKPFDEAAGWEAFDPARLPGEPFGMCVGAVFDGRWVYFAPYGHSAVVRYDTSAVFGDPGSWEWFRAESVAGLHTRGYDGAAFDGRWVYFIPFWEGEEPGHGFHARTLRYDTTRPFHDPASWQAADGSVLAPPNPGGFNGGAFDGRFLYLAPWRQDDPSGEIVAHGHVLRLDTAGPGARFQLRLADCGHNGGLGGAVPGPTFLVNCAGGPVSVQAHRALGAGWHHLAGVYRASAGAELWIDGERVSTAPARGAPVGSAAPVTAGRLAGGAGTLGGELAHARMRVGAVPDGWVRTAWESLREPTGFATVVE